MDSLGSSSKQDESFLWGSATSAYQVEGGNIWSDWYKWEKNNGWEECGQAVNHYTKFNEDFSLVKQLKQNSHRFSVEWSRLEPAPGQISQTAIDHYHQVIKNLRKLDIKIFLTLNHFTLPQWLADIGGWENPQALYYFKKFVNLIIKEYGQAIDFWITINEPLVLATEGYLYGHWPPQVRSWRRTKAVFRNLALAHNEAYKIIHQALPGAKVGLAHNFFSIEPLRPWLILDKIAARRAETFWNIWIMKLTAGHHDFIGLNYYFHQRAFASLNWRRGFVSFADPKKLNKEISRLGWEINPDGLRQVAINLYKLYHLPIYVTENGLAPISDDQQISFIKRSVAAISEARENGAKVQGYFYWSLLDNFEWDKGWGPKFGLVTVDRQTWARSLKPAASVYAAICSSKFLRAADFKKNDEGVHL